MTIKDLQRLIDADTMNQEQDNPEFKQSKVQTLQYIKGPITYKRRGN